MTRQTPAVVLPFRRPLESDDEPYCRLPYLMEHFGVSESTIRRWTPQMPAEATKVIGRCRLYRLSRVERWVEQNAS